MPIKLYVLWSLAFLCMTWGSSLVGTASPIEEVPAVITCDGGELGFLVARRDEDGVAFYLAVVPGTPTWNQIVCALQMGQLVTAMAMGKES